MFINKADVLEVSFAMFRSNEASLGGAVYIAAVDDKQTIFSACTFERNGAGDGGAVYLYTGPGVDIFTTTAFRNNFARELRINTSIPGLWDRATAPLSRNFALESLINTSTYKMELPHRIVAILQSNTPGDMEASTCHFFQLRAEIM